MLDMGYEREVERLNLVRIVGGSPVRSVPNHAFEQRIRNHKLLMNSLTLYTSLL